MHPGQHDRARLLQPRGHAGRHPEDAAADRGPDEDGDGAPQPEVARKALAPGVSRGVGMAKYTLDKGLPRSVSFRSMSMTEPDRTRLLRRLAAGGAGLAFGLIVLGGVVRITGSGMGCGDHWPRCDGEWFPPLDLPTLIEIGHRWAAALVSLLVLGVGGRRLAPAPAERAAPPARPPWPACVLVVQVLLGAVTVKLALPPWVIITHLANAMVLLALLVVVALRAGPGGAASGPLAPAERHAAMGWSWRPRRSGSS